MPKPVAALISLDAEERAVRAGRIRALLGHTRLETTQLYAQIRPAALKHAVDFYEAKALDVLST